ncbi:hypothetical protein R1sor_020739 [Riccia sorocarpa]|uniref:Maturase K n=1 Tax=Riccia sorocarpa TaxID=122646 RepID=A0ABD3GFT4_9MARC
MFSSISFIREGTRDVKDLFDLFRQFESTSNPVSTWRESLSSQKHPTTVRQLSGEEPVLLHLRLSKDARHERSLFSFSSQRRTVPTSAEIRLSFLPERFTKVCLSTRVGVSNGHPGIVPASFIGSPVLFLTGAPDNFHENNSTLSKLVHRRKSRMIIKLVSLLCWVALTSVATGGSLKRGLVNSISVQRRLTWWYLAQVFHSSEARALRDWLHDVEFPSQLLEAYMSCTGKHDLATDKRRRGIDDEVVGLIGASLLPF